MEHRSASRVRSVLKAEIRYNDGMMSSHCLVRDISDTGARIELSGDIALPDRFELYIEKRHRTYHAVVKRRSGREVGVAFDEPVAAPTPGSDMLDRVAKLEAEVAELRQVIAAIAAAVERNNESSRESHPKDKLPSEPTRLHR